MAVFTTTLEVMVNNLAEDRTAPLRDRIESARSKIFDFDYPVPATIWGEPFKEYFETAFINKYLFDEIGFETVERWKQRVYSRLLDIMPRYKLLFDILNKIDIDTILNDKSYSESNTGTKTNELSSKTQSQSGSKSTSSTLPENMLSNGQIGNFSKVGYADNANVSRSTSQAEGESNSNESNKNERKITGRTISQMSIFGELDGNFNNYFNQFLNEFSDLFMSLYY